MKTNLIKRAEFLQLVEAVVKAAMPNIVSLDLVICHETGEYVIATCTNGAEYRIRTEADSLITMVSDIIDFLKYK